MFLGFAFPDPHSHQETSSLDLAEIRRIQKAAKDPSIGRECPLEMKKHRREIIPREKILAVSGDNLMDSSSLRFRKSDNSWLLQVLIGASNSSKTGS